MAPKISDILSKMNVNADSAKFLDKFLYKKGECKCLGTCTCTSKDPKLGLTDTIDSMDKLKKAPYQTADQTAYEEVDIVALYADAISKTNVERPFTNVTEATLGGAKYKGKRNPNTKSDDITLAQDLSILKSKKKPVKEEVVAEDKTEQKPHINMYDSGEKSNEKFAKQLAKKAAAKKLTKEEAEQIDEISKHTLGKYIKAAVNDKSDSEHSAAVATTDANVLRNKRQTADNMAQIKDNVRYAKHFKKQADKRTTGIDRAVKRLTREEVVAEGYTAKQLKNMALKHEAKEFEHASEVIKHTKKSAEAAEQNDWKAENEAEQMADGHRRAGNKHGAVARMAGELAWKARDLENKKNPPAPIQVAAVPLKKFTVKEEAEQIDEISKTKAGRYIQKSADDMQQGLEGWNQHQTFTGKETGTDRERKDNKMMNLGRVRAAGIVTATKKLIGKAKVNATNEEVEKLDEAYVKQKAYTHPTNGKSAHVGWSAEHQEFKVKLLHNGEHQKDADYFTNDKADAHGTAKHMIGMQNS